MINPGTLKEIPQKQVNEKLNQFAVQLMLKPG
jgi:hypothetical protein